MINYFYEYIRRIIIFLIFTSFLQIIMPNSKYKNYLHLVLAVIFIFIVIEPITKVYKSLDKLNPNIQSEVFFEEGNISNFNTEIKEYTAIQNEIIIDLFKDNIKAQIEKIISDKFYINNIEIVLEEDKYYNVVIENLSLFLTRTNNRKISVKKFNEDNQNIQNEDNIEINKIKKSISNFYNLSVDNIFIKIT